MEVVFGSKEASKFWLEADENEIEFVICPHGYQGKQRQS